LVLCCWRCVAGAAGGEQEKLKTEVAAAMAALDELTNEAQEVMNSQQELEATQQQQEAVLAEVTERRERKQNEVSVGPCGVPFRQTSFGPMTLPANHGVTRERNVKVQVVSLGLLAAARTSRGVPGRQTLTGSVP
jgi:hypothetical protein